MNKVKVLMADIYFVNFCPGQLTVPIANLVESWDGSLYVETNILEACGPNRSVRMTSDGFLIVGGCYRSCGAEPFHARALFNKHLTQ
jgi:hypothetical protein